MCENTLSSAPLSATTKPSELANAPRAYAIGENAGEIAKHLFPGHEVIECDSLPEEPAQRLLLNCCLQYLTYGAGLAALQTAGALVLPGGELHVIVPSADWAVRELMKPEPSPAAEFVLYGKQWSEDEVYHSGWTIPRLRTFISRCGFIVREARALDAAWTLRGPDGQEREEPIRLNYVVGGKANVSDRE